MRLFFLMYIILGLNYLYPQQPIYNVQLNDIFFSDSLHGCAVGDDGVVLYSSDGGINWLLTKIDTTSDGSSPGYCSSVYFRDSLNGFITYSKNDYGVVTNTLLQTRDGGKSWEPLVNVEPGLVSSVFIDSANGYVLGDEAFISKTTDNGQTWITKNFISGSSIILSSLGFIDKNVGWAAGSTNSSFSGVLLWTEDSGENWKVIDSSTAPYVFRNAKFFTTTTGIVAAIDGVFKTTDRGATWTNKYFGNFNHLSFVNEKVGWAVGYHGSIVKTIDGGETWVVQSSPITNETYYSVYFINENRGWIACGGHTTILSTSDGGDHWNIQFSDVTSVGKNNSPIKKFNLSQNYPNPFNPSTTIQYAVPKPGLVTLKVYDMLGKEVATLVNGNKVAGEYSVNFNASNLASGIYFYRITAGGFTDTKKLILLK